MEKQEKPRSFFNKLQDPNTKVGKGLVIGTIVFFILVVLAIAGGSSIEEQAKVDQPQPQESIQPEVTENTALSEDAVERECQDAKYYQGSDYYNNYVGGIISVFDYGFTMMTDGTYDSDGNEIFSVYWNGKSKDGEKIRFACYISGSNDENLTVHYIGGNLTDIWKTYEDLDYNSSYDKDGNRIER